MSKKFLLLLFSICILTTTASAGFWENLTETKYADTIQDLPSTDGNPDKVLQKSGHIEGWIDIVGYRQMVRDGGIEYVNGNPADYAIVQYGVWGSFPKGQKCYTCTVDYIHKDVKVTSSGEYTIATIYLEMLWHETLCDQNSCWDVYTTEKATFSDLELSPRIFNSSAFVKIYENYYNVTNYSRTTLDLELSNAITKYIISTHDGKVTARLKVGEIKYTKKGIPFLNLYNFDMRTIEGNISANRNHIVFACSNYTARFFSPFQELNLTPQAVPKRFDIVQLRWQLS